MCHRSQRMPAELLVRRHDRIVEWLRSLGLAPRQRDAVLLLLRLHAHYTYVFPAAATAAEEAGISRRTWWRAVALLRDLRLVRPVARYLAHRQLSDLYDLEALVLALLRWLASRAVWLPQAAWESLRRPLRPGERVRGRALDVGAVLPAGGDR